MKVFVVGGGGREDVLAWKLAYDSAAPVVFCAPGNAGTRRYATNLPVAADDIDGLVAWACAERPDLTVVGPEAPLCAGLVDRLEAEGLRVFGPSGEAAQLEGSKVFSKEIMAAAGVPTAECRHFDEIVAAEAYIREVGAPIVIKAEGLAAGKGVTVCLDLDAALTAAREALVDNAFGTAGARILVEEFMEGEEASVLALVDGEHVVMLPGSQDHKRALDNDQGPNTGGMGAYSPAPVIGSEDLPVIRDTVIEPVLAEMRSRGIPYKGVLYAGLMFTPEGIRVLEFNCRFGDPEVQAVLRRLAGDLLPVLDACVDGDLTDAQVSWSDEASACVVMASGGYPGAYDKGKPIDGIETAEQSEGVVVFHAGTDVDSGGQVVTAGGRVLNVTATGVDLEQAVERAYGAVDKISFEGAHWRRDIAARALSRITA